LNAAVVPRYFAAQAFLVLVITQALERAIRKLHQPPVVGEILGGIVLGPSVLGRIHGFSDTFFPPGSLSHFSLIANVGLVFFMFFLGLELDVRLMKHQMKVAVPIAASAIAFPFAVGAVSSIWLFDENGRDGEGLAGFTAFILFFGAAMSFTAFPVLASVLQTSGLLTDPLGVLAFSCAAIDDIMAWCVLAFASSFSKAKEPIRGLYTTLLAAAFVAVMIVVVRPLLKRINAWFAVKERVAVLRKHRQATELVTAALASSNPATAVRRSMSSVRRRGPGVGHARSSSTASIAGAALSPARDSLVAAARVASPDGEVKLRPSDGSAGASAAVEDATCSVAAVDRTHSYAAGGATHQAGGVGSPAAVSVVPEGGGSVKVDGPPNAGVDGIGIGDGSGGDDDENENENESERLHEVHLNRGQLTIVFLVLIAAAFVAEGIGIHAFFGAFVAGLVVPKEGRFARDLAPRIEVCVPVLSSCRVSTRARALLQ
jgi:Kef-type K+ transport system membrane component KefB